MIEEHTIKFFYLNGFMYIKSKKNNEKNELHNYRSLSKAQKYIMRSF